MSDIKSLPIKKKFIKIDQILLSCLFVQNYFIFILTRWGIIVLKYGFCKCRYIFVKKKVSNLSELHFSEVTAYKIHTKKMNISENNQ